MNMPNDRLGQTVSSIDGCEIPDIREVVQPSLRGKREKHLS